MTLMESRPDLEAGADPHWIDVCALNDLVPERGAAALVSGEQVALFRSLDNAVYAVGNRDPFSGAHVIARGIVGTKGEVPMVASPMFKQHFSLLTGICLEDPSVRIPVHQVRVESGRVLVALARPGEEGSDDG